MKLIHCCLMAVHCILPGSMQRSANQSLKLSQDLVRGDIQIKKKEKEKKAQISIIGFTTCP